MSSAVLAVREALYAALTGDVDLAALLGTDASHSGVYDAQAPKDAPFDYIVLGDTSEDDVGTMGNEAKAGRESIRIHTEAGPAERTGSTRARTLYVHVERVLNGQALSVGGRSMYLGRTSLVASYVEPDGRRVTAAIEYTFRTMEPLGG